MEMIDNNKISLLPDNVIIHIASWKQDNGVMIFSTELENKEVEVELMYPLKIKHSFTYSDNGAGDVTDLISKIVSEYKNVYSRPKEFGIWGHSIEDLVIENLRIDLSNNKILLYVGS